MCPNVRIIWSDILMQRYLSVAMDGKVLEMARKRMNLLVRNLLMDIRDCVIRHCNKRAKIFFFFCEEQIALNYRTLVMLFT